MALGYVGDGGYPAPRRRGMPGWGWVLLTLGVLVLLCGGGFVACAVVGGQAVIGASEAVEREAADKRDDVTLDACEGPTSIDSVTVRYTIVNSSSSARTYVLDFELMSGNTRVGTAHGIETDVAAGATAKGEAVGIVSQKGAVRCVLVEVS